MVDRNHDDEKACAFACGQGEIAEGCRYWGMLQGTFTQVSGCQPLCIRSYKVQQKLSLFTIVVVSVSVWVPAALNWIL